MFRSVGTSPDWQLSRVSHVHGEAGHGNTTLRRYDEFDFVLHHL